MQNYSHPCFVEITLISAQNLRVDSSAFCRVRRLRPFITVTTSTTYGDKQLKVFKTQVDDEGGVNPTWGDRFHFHFDQTFFSGIYLQLYTKHLMMGNTQLGWCLIPATDIVDRFSPVGSTRFLSYRLRDSDGSRGHGVVNVAVKLEGNPPTPHPQQPLLTLERNVSEMVIGIPVKMKNEFSQGQATC
ncbi:BON1-associated protein 2 [Abeliophyllum distichum]|uniref:BON1-associated protein 2 n=1 Tax=Abeliophyllum distichum TaxID=126358 RepID=A0ABD1TWD9_9LAMI